MGCKRTANLPTSFSSKWETPQVLPSACKQADNKMGEYRSCKSKLSSASVFFGGIREQREDRPEEHEAISTCANHLKRQQFSRSNACQLQHSPGPKGLKVPCPDSGPIDCEAAQADQKALAMGWEQCRPRALSCHPRSALCGLNIAPLVVAVPVVGRGWLTLGWVRPTTQKAADSEFCLSFWDFCFVFFPLVVQFPHITATGTVFASKGRVLHNFGGRMWRRGSCLEKLAASRKNKKLKGHHGFGLSGGNEVFFLFS